MITNKKLSEIIKSYRIEELIKMDQEEVYELILRDTLRLIFLFEIVGYSLDDLNTDIIGLSKLDSSLIEIKRISSWLNDNPPVYNFLIFVKEGNLKDSYNSNRRRMQLFKTYWALHKLVEQNSFLFKE